MIINIILLIIFLCSLVGILFIISQKLPLLANIDLSQLPEERAARAKKSLLEKRMGRQVQKTAERFKVKLADLKIRTENIFEFFKSRFLKLRSRVLDFFKKMR